MRIGYRGKFVDLRQTEKKGDWRKQLNEAFNDMFSSIKLFG